MLAIALAFLGAMPVYAGPAGNSPVSSVTMFGGSLVSGIAPIRKTLDAYMAGDLATYDRVVTMTKADGWKQSP